MHTVGTRGRGSLESVYYGSFECQYRSCLLSRARWMQESQDLTMKTSVEQMATIKLVEELRAGCRSHHFRQISDLDADVR